MTATAAPILTARGFLFDLDGTLVDSTATVERHWRRFAERHRLDPGALLATVHGRRSIDVIRDLEPRLRAPADELLRDFETHDSDDTTGVTALPGAARTLQGLPPGSWAVVTSGSTTVAHARLRAASLPIPDVLVTADDVDAGKPDPAPYLLAARLLAQPPEMCLAIEDAPQGLLSATRAGCRTLALLTTHRWHQLAGANTTADDLTAVHLLHDRAVEN